MKAACTLSDTILYGGERTLELVPGTMLPLTVQGVEAQALRFALRIPSGTRSERTVSCWMSDGDQEVPGTRVSTRGIDAPTWREIGPIMLGPGQHQLTWNTDAGGGDWPAGVAYFHLGRVFLGQAPVNLSCWSCGDCTWTCQAARSILQARDVRTGMHAWSVELPAPVHARPAVIEDSIYVVAADGVLYGISCADGAIVYQATVIASPPGGRVMVSANVMADGICYVTSELGLHAFDVQARRLVWFHETLAGIPLAPVPCRGLLCFGRADGVFEALQADTGAAVFPARRIADQPLYISPQVVGVVVVVGTADGDVFGLDALAADRIWSLRERQLQVRHIIDKAPAAISYIDTDLRYRLVNHAYERWFGWSPAAVQGRRVRDMLGEPAWAVVQGYLERALRGEVVTFESEIPYRDGGARWVQAVYSPDCHPDGSVRGIVAMIYDISESKRVQEAWQRVADRAERLRNSVVALGQALTEQQVAEVIIQQGLQALGAVAGCVALVAGNGGVLEVVEQTGYDPAVMADWMTFPIEANIPLAVAARTRSPVFTGSRAERAEKFPGLPPFLRSGPPGASASIPLTIGDRLLGAMVFAWPQPTDLGDEDKTFVLALARQCAQALDRAQLYAAEQRARARAEASDAAKDRFLAVLSHELRTPLMPVLTGAAMLENEELAPTRVRQLASTIRKNAELEARLIDDLLDLTRVSQGKLTLHPEPVDAHAIVRNVLRVCAADLESKQLRLAIELAAADHLVLADQARLQQVIWNLIKNAAKFSHAGAGISIRTRNDTSGMLALEVADEGIGIAPAVMPNIFNPFEQGGDDVTRRFGGLGLGLAISKTLVEAQGGTIAAASPGTGQGATFTVQIPLSRAPVALEPSAAAPAPATAHRLLLVEDNGDTAMLLAEYLEMRGYVVKTAGTVANALNLLDTEAFDAVISDLGLPDGTGLELMRQITARQRVPGVALSGYGSEKDIRESKAAGFREHLVKPVNPTHLVEALCKILGEDVTR